MPEDSTDAQAPANKMVEAGALTGPLADAARSRMRAAGYSVPESAELRQIHCNTQPGCEQLSWLENGFVQCFVQVDGRAARVMDYAPGQQLQPHRHDIDELFQIRGGAVLVSKWPNGEPTERQTAELGAGDMLEIPSGAVHALFCDRTEGLQFHELVGEGAEAFQKRSTEFLVGRGFEMARPAACQGGLAGKVVVVTGSNRGLGLGFVQYALERGAVVVATCRNPAKAEALQALLEGHPESFAVPLDLQDQASIAAAAEAIGSRVEAVDVLINNAGISSKNHPVDPILSACADDVMNVLSTNVVGTLATTQAFLALLRAGRTKVVLNLSSQLASIDKCWGIQGRYGGVASYRMSRAANNMMSRCFGGELKDEGFVFISMSPGHVATDMGSAGGRTPGLQVPESVNGMLDCIESCTTADNGKFLQYDGTELPW